MIWSLQLFLALSFGSMTDARVCCAGGCVMSTFTLWVVERRHHLILHPGTAWKASSLKLAILKMLGGFFLLESERKITLVLYHLRNSHLTCVYKMDVNHSLHERWTATSDRLSKLAQKYEEGTRFVFDLSVWYFPYTRLGYERNSAA